MYGAEVARCLFRKFPGCRIYGLGGQRMRDAGVDIEGDISHTAVVGPFEADKLSGNVVQSLSESCRTSRSEPPTAAILIDFPDFNLRLAKRLKDVGVAGDLLHQPTGLGLARRPGQADSQTREQDARHFSVRRGDLSESGRRRGVRRASVDRHGSRDKVQGRVLPGVQARSQENRSWRFFREAAERKCATFFRPCARPRSRLRRRNRTRNSCLPMAPGLDRAFIESIVQEPDRSPSLRMKPTMPFAIRARRLSQAARPRSKRRCSARRKSSFIAFRGQRGFSANFC